MERQTDGRTDGHGKGFCYKNQKEIWSPVFYKWKSREDTKLRRNRGKKIPSSFTSRSTTSIFNFTHKERNES